MMEAEDVAAWLRNHPGFFDEHADVFANLRLPHPEGGHAISMVERQLIALREKNTQLERRVTELIGYGQHNDVLADKLHRLTIALLRADDPEMTLDVVRESMQTDYRVPFVALKQWAPPTFDDVSDAMQSYVVGLDQPYVGPHLAYESLQWFELDGSPASDLKSFAYVPLVSGEVFGVLCLASDDASRFTPDMAVDVLKRIGNLVSAALSRFAAHAEERFDELG
jgi:uncharacterized protein